MPGNELITVEDAKHILIRVYFRMANSSTLNFREYKNAVKVCYSELSGRDGNQAPSDRIPNPFPLPLDWLKTSMGGLVGPTLYLSEETCARHYALDLRKFAVEYTGRSLVSMITPKGASLSWPPHSPEPWSEWLVAYGALHLGIRDWHASFYPGGRPIFEEPKLIKLVLSDFSGESAPGYDFSGCILSGLKFRNAKLAGASFRDCEGIAVDFQEADLAGACFSGASLENAIFSNARANESDFSGAVIKSANFRGTFLKGAKFEGARISRSYFDDSPPNG